MKSLSAALLVTLGALLQEPVSVRFSTLSRFDYQIGMTLPAEVRKLDGTKIAIAGFIRTEDGRTDDIREFWLVDQGCDCQGTPKINEMIWCTLPEGRTIGNDDAPIVVSGAFSASEVRDGDYVVSLYRMTVDQVR